MKVVILAGGFGTRISEESHLKPKPMIEIGGKPILWHIMKIYSALRLQRLRHLPRLQGLRDQGVFRQLLPPHVRRHLRSCASNEHGRSTSSTAEPWRVTLVDTGDGDDDRRAAASASGSTSDEETFCSPTATAWPTSTSRDLVAFHRAHGKLGHPDRGAAGRALRRPRHRRTTGCTASRRSRRATAAGSTAGSSSSSPGSSTTSRATHTVLEREPLETLARDGQLAAYRHQRLLAAHGHPAGQEPPRGALGSRARRPGRSGE